MASTEEGKARVAKSAAGTYVFNERKMLDASHVVVFCAKTAMDDAWLERVVDQEEADGRFNTPEAKAANHKGRTYFADMHRVDLKDDDQWMAKQVYLNVGNFLLGVGAMGLDAVPIEVRCRDPRRRVWPERERLHQRSGGAGWPSQRGRFQRHAAEVSPAAEHDCDRVLIPTGRRARPVTFY